MSTVRCGVIILAAVLVPEMLPGKWHKGVLQNVLAELTGEIPVGEDKRQFDTTVKSSPDV